MTRLFAAVGLFLSVALFFFACAGCQSLNEDPNNTRCWFPSLVQPGHLNPDHEKYYLDGSDPYPTAYSGKDMTMRPPGWNHPRDWNQDVTYTRDSGTVATGASN